MEHKLTKRTIVAWITQPHPWHSKTKSGNFILSLKPGSAPLMNNLLCCFVPHPATLQLTLVPKWCRAGLGRQAPGARHDNLWVSVPYLCLHLSQKSQGSRSWEERHLDQVEASAYPLHCSYSCDLAQVAPSAPNEDSRPQEGCRGIELVHCQALRKKLNGDSWVVQWLGLRAPNAGGVGSIPGQGTKILHAAWPAKN